MLIIIKHASELAPSFGPDKICSGHLGDSGLLTAEPASEPLGVKPEKVRPAVKRIRDLSIIMTCDRQTARGAQDRVSMIGLCQVWNLGYPHGATRTGGASPGTHPLGV